MDLKTLWSIWERLAGGSGEGPREHPARATTASQVRYRSLCPSPSDDVVKKTLALGHVQVRPFPLRVLGHEKRAPF